MEIFILKLAVAVIPLVFLVVSVNISTSLSHWYVHNPLARHRRRRHLLRTQSHGLMLR